MTAIACLRILFTDGESRPGEVPKHKAQGVADAFLKARWRKPRKCGAVAPLAFVIADTRVDQLDPTELQALAAELEKVLFPGRPIGTIALMSFEGDEQAVLKFASLSEKELMGLMAGEGYGGDAGRVHVVRADSVHPLPCTREEAKAQAAEKAAAAQPPVADPPPAAKPAPPKTAARIESPPPAAETGWWGVQDLAQGVFVGSAIGLRADLIGPVPEDDAKLLKRDLICLTDAQAALKTAAFGEIHVPFSFWNLTTPSSQDAYRGRLSRYPLDQRPRLCATVYGTPREASIGMLQQARAFLKGGFALMDVRITDPTFPIQSLSPDLVDSITLVLSGETEQARLKQILKFVERKAGYVAKGVRQAVANVTSAVELEACKVAGVARVQGPIVTDLLDKPVDGPEAAEQAKNAA
ncbi:MULTISPECIES: hypothetical protein [Caulobacter]|uniref:Uncharacterized protein n=1 Tax=Caulobacter vibrioides OR37 TaxID=1292034 RepID=R0CW70_CAUVI|nr:MULTISPECIES: hypothetical protein [Caulobacter]ENZ80731.1 hypothetical protein OR37_03311 [Caulobacter vibrioides OR37]MBQ1563377.1 hypothetical protein [Caulobacter sp.]